MVNGAANAVTAGRTDVGAPARAHRPTAGTGVAGTPGTSAFTVRIQCHRPSARIGIGQAAARPDAVRETPRVFLRRPLDRKTGHLRVITDRRAPADDNCAERDIRMSISA
ncbi:hypothetical protein GCM10009678_33950 [Actinomadura kijaniata]